MSVMRLLLTKLPASKRYKYTPDDKDTALNATVCVPAFITLPLTNLATSCPNKLYIVSLTGEASARLKLIFVVGLNGFG